MAFGHGPTAREEQILSLWDAGHRPAHIAAEMGVGEPYVSNVLSRLANAGSSRKFEEMVERGSAALLRALRRHHPAPTHQLLRVPAHPRRDTL